MKRDSNRFRYPCLRCVLVTLGAGALLLTLSAWFFATVLLLGLGLRASGLPRIVHDQVKWLTKGATREGRAGSVDLIVPVMGVDREDLVDSFDDRRSGGRNHEAIDIAAARHTPVVAVEDGTIAKLVSSRGGGVTIYQYDPGRSRIYYYAHLERYTSRLEEGAVVRKGQVLGFVGTSGNATTPHLHFAVHQLDEDDGWWEGEPVDPCPLFQSSMKRGANVERDQRPDS